MGGRCRQAVRRVATAAQAVRVADAPGRAGTSLPLLLLVLLCLLPSIARPATGTAEAPAERSVSIAPADIAARADAE